MGLAKSIYRLSDVFPKMEEYRMTSQLVRAAISIPANIAEGDARGTRREYAHFVGIARGSAAELETLLMLAKDVGLAEERAFEAPLKDAADVGRMLNALRRSLAAGPPNP